MSDAESVSRWARAFVLASVGFLVGWSALEVAGIGRRVGVVLGLYGFVLHMVFGKAYSLVPSYFGRSLGAAWPLPFHLALTAPGVALLAAGPVAGLPGLTALGGGLWLGGVLVFVSTLLWTVRGNLAGVETGTSDANADRRGVDRFANAFIPVVLAYLLAGSYAVAAPGLGLPPVVDGYPPRATHLLAAGTAALLVFAVGFRLLPRFLVVRPATPLVWVVLPAGALGPALLAASVAARGALFVAGAALEAIAVFGFSAAYVAMFVRSDRDRVGLYGPLAGVVAGSAAVLLGLRFALVGATAGLTALHLRFNLLGFLGLTIVGLAYQFYPPAVGSFPGASDRTALASILAIFAGLGAEAAGVLFSVPALGPLGRVLVLLGALLYAGLILGLFNERYWSGS
ncbi:MAG: hypothetical protein ABEH66_00150 [Halobacteriales archaeon]